MTSTLKPLSSVQLTADERKILDWMRKVAWEPQEGKRDPIPYRARVPEFFGGVRMYRNFAQGPSAGSLGALDLFVKKLSFQGVIGKQELYPVETIDKVHYLSLKKADLDNLGVGQDEGDDE